MYHHKNSIMQHCCETPWKKSHYNYNIFDKAIKVFKLKPDYFILIILTIWPWPFGDSKGLMVMVKMVILTMTIWKIQGLHGHGHGCTPPPKLKNVALFQIKKLRNFWFKKMQCFASAALLHNVFWWPRRAIFIDDTLYIPQRCIANTT